MLVIATITLPMPELQGGVMLIQQMSTAGNGPHPVLPNPNQSILCPQIFLFYSSTILEKKKKNTVGWYRGNTESIVMCNRRVFHYALLKLFNTNWSNLVFELLIYSILLFHVVF